MTTIEPLFRVEFSAQGLMREHPPRWQHPNKKAVFAMCCPPGCRHGGRIVCTRWEAMPLPEMIDASEAARTHRPSVARTCSTTRPPCPGRTESSGT